MPIPILLAIFIAFHLTPASADNSVMTVSTNNTPLDRQVLQKISEEAFGRIGINFNLISLPSERSLRSANAGEIDGEGLRVAGLTSQYPNLIQVPEAFIRISFVAFSKDATIDLHSGWDSLKPYRIGYITGWKMFEEKATGAKIVNKVDTPDQLFQMLQSDRIDLALYTRSDGIFITREKGYSTMAPLLPALKDVDMFLYLNRKHESLVASLTAALKGIKADGTYNRILSAISAP